MRRLLLGIMGTLLATLSGLTLQPVTPGIAAAAAPTFGPAQKLDAYGGGTEPRIAVAPNDKRYVVTNQTDGSAVFWKSDTGSSWQKLTGTIPGQVSPTIDTDIIALSTGRLVASELDFAGPAIYTAYSDDEGKTWTRSTGTDLADQDRQWYAEGIVDPTTGKPRVYMMSHNLFSGEGNHNMFVATSTDGGATFGPPIPTTLPGDQAYADLQCADSGGPSNLIANRKTGQVYAIFGTRSAFIAGPVNAGGCGASVVGSFQINVVAATKIWVATSMDGSAGSWTQSAAVDDSVSGKIVGMQLNPGALDNQGNVYVTYPESPSAYPDYSRAAVKMAWAPANLSKWSEPAVVAPGGTVGHLLVHAMAGDPGKLDFAYFTGVARPNKTPLWYATVAQTLNGRDANPTFTETRLSDIATYTLTPSAMMGTCSTNPILNGFACNRSTDVWGVALDASCNFMVTWPVSGDSSQNDATNKQGGTYVATQTGGPTVCVKAASTTATPPPFVAVVNPLPDTSRGPGGRGPLWLGLPAALVLASGLVALRRRARRPS